jgi:RNA polymerase sigma-70 factor, ECF subfamily
MLAGQTWVDWIALLVEHEGAIGPVTESFQATLVRRAQAGDPEAFEILIRNAGDRLLGIARKILRDPDAADDAFQSAVITAWRTLPGVRDPGRIDGWLYKLLVSACYAEAKRRRRFAARVRVIATEPSGDERVEGFDEREALERAFRSISPAHRAVVVLHHYADLPLVEVAAILGVSPGTARSRLHYALRALRSALDADDRPTIEELR